jgi:alpha-glucosidase
MPSPDEDWGYDVSDYTDVHPELGTLADLDELIAEAGRRGMRVLLDLVPNHTSSAHPWFVDAATRDAAHRDYYVWADPGPDGGPPNNWLDFTGRPAWQWHESGQYYLHNFLPGQPDLNWWERAVHREFRDILEFWFERGVAGFRVDVANGLYKDAELRDNPPATDDNPLDGAFGLRAVYNSNRPETHGVYRDWRKIAESYSPARLLLGETWVPDAERLAAYYGDHDELQLGFNFLFAFARFDPARLAEIVAHTLAALPPGACPVWMGSNHDLGRFTSRWCGGDERKIRLALLVLATLPGTSVLYYGDEIGMTDLEVPVALRRDNATLDVGQGADRDRARTPLPWDGAPGGGFTGPGVTPWLPMAEHPARTVADQRDDPDSTMWLCRRLIALRRAELGGGIAEFENLHVGDGQWAYRVGDLVVAANFTGRPTGRPAAAGEVLLSSATRVIEATGVRGATGVIEAAAGPGLLRPWEGIVARPARG